MSLALYLDHNADPAIANGLRRQNIDVIVALEDGAERLMDERLLERSTRLGRVLFTHDDDFLEIGPRWQKEDRPFGGIVYAQQQRLTIGQIVEDLALIAGAMSVEEVANRVIYLPL